MALAFSDRYSGPYIATSGQIIFTADWPLLGLDIEVRKDGQILSGGNYTITETSGGFEIELKSGCTAGQVIEIIGASIPSRETEFSPLANFRAEKINSELDILQAQVQENKRDLDRGLKLPYGETGMVLPDRNLLKGQLLGFNSITGEPEPSAAAMGAAYTKAQSDAVFIRYLTDYAALRAYIGDTKFVQIYGASTFAALPNGTQGIFYHDASDTTSTDNGGTIIVGADGRRWKRQITGNTYLLEWFGAKGDGTTINTTSIQAAFDALRVVKCRLIGLGGIYLVDNTITIGNGSATAISTWHNGLTFELPASGVDLGSSGNGVLSSIKATGANFTGTEPIIKINGGIHSFKWRDMIIDCNNLTANGVEFNHPLKCQVKNVTVVKQKSSVATYGIKILSRDNAAYAAPHTAGTTQGAMENVFKNFSVRDPNGSASAIYIAGGKVNNIGFSRNKFVNCEWVRGNASGGTDISVTDNYIDGNTFDNCFTVSTHATPSTGKARRTLTQSSGGLANVITGENRIIGGSWVGAIERVDDTALTASTNGGHELEIGLKESDGAPKPSNTNYKRHVISDTGVLMGKWSGSTERLHSKKEALTTGDYEMAAFIAPCGLILRALRANILTAPTNAGSNRGIVVRVNGVDTALLLFWNTAQFGDKNIQSDIVVNGGDIVSILAFNGGSPVGTNAYATLSYQALENV